MWENELLPNVVDHLAKVAPTSTWAEYPRSSASYDDGFFAITYKDLANAINGLAWWLHDTLGPGNNHRVLAYIGPNDLRYSALVLAANKAGYLVRKRFSLSIIVKRSSITADSCS